MKKQNDSIGQQLKNISEEVKFARAKMFPLPSLNDIGNDGENHINIWESGHTNLGRALSSFTAMPFKHDVYGKFTSIEGFWHYIRSVTKDDDLRHLSGYNARSFGRSLKNDNVPDMYYIIADANWQKIKAYPVLVEEIRNLHIPFDSYYIEDNRSNKNVMIRARSLHSKWLVPAFHEIHEAVHQDREPDFSFLKDENKNQFYHPLVKKERFEGGYNAHLLDMYKQKPFHSKPKKKPSFLESSKKDKSYGVDLGNESEVEIDDLTIDTLAAKKAGMDQPKFQDFEQIESMQTTTVKTDEVVDSIVMFDEPAVQVEEHSVN